MPCSRLAGLLPVVYMCACTIILKDYVRTILNCNRTDNKWDLDPRSADGKTLFAEEGGEAVGNQVSVELNLVYR
jgi:linoleate 8R-lipoxygenase/9,12-octadecadienoate 8-hydroperoxide 8R-isomerase